MVLVNWLVIYLVIQSVSQSVNWLFSYCYLKMYLSLLSYDRFCLKTGCFCLLNTLQG